MSLQPNFCVHSSFALKLTIIHLFNVGSKQYIIIIHSPDYYSLFHNLNYYNLIKIQTDPQATIWFGITFISRFFSCCHMHVPYVNDEKKCGIIMSVNLKSSKDFRKLTSVLNRRLQYLVKKSARPQQCCYIPLQYYYIYSMQFSTTVLQWQQMT